ncbi:MAG: InlB B-repeat-containing protein, partial [Cuniculiplasma sp.]
MKILALVISFTIIFAAFLGISFVPELDHNSNGVLLATNTSFNPQTSSSDPSVHLFVNGNGWVIFSANYSCGGISFSFVNDKSTNFTTNSVPSGTLFHLVSSPNSGYYFVHWTGSVNSTSSSINITVNQNINEEAIYKQIPTFPVSFTESGLPLGVAWYINVTGMSSSGPITHNSYNVSLQNGTYSYSISTSNKDYAPNSYGGSLTISGASLSAPAIIFTLQVYNVSFTESGLNTGSWYVNLSNGMTGSAVAGSLITFTMQNATYSYTVATSDKIFHASSYNNTAIVNGNTSLSETFVTTTFQIEFIESGLPAGALWFSNITGLGSSGPITHNTYNFSLQNGSYTFSISTSNKDYAASSTSGNFNVNGVSSTISITFNPINYKTTFTESGLPSGTVWYVNLSNGMNSGAITGTSYSFSLTNGTYSYTIGTTDKIYESSSGSITVNGNSISKAVSFLSVKYSSTFTESGLPSGTVWYVNLSNGMNSGAITGTSYSFSLTNGTYSYNIATTDKIYHANTGSITINGKNESQPITFSKFTYTVMFSETGLPSGSTWCVNLSNGMSSGAITGTTYSFFLINGTYSYTIGTTDKIYESSSGSITVNGGSVSNTVPFSAVDYTVTFTESGLPSGTVWYV